MKRSLYLVVVASVLLAGCKREAEDNLPYLECPNTPVRLPKLDGWLRDPSVKLGDPAKGGNALRLVRESAVPGSPRVSLGIEPLKTRPTVLEEYLTDSLREMGSLEAQGKIRIIAVDQRPVTVSGLRAFRVRHEYTMGTGASQIAITQISVFLVAGGRGHTVTAAGRTELFHPLAGAIEELFAKLAVAPDRRVDQPKAPPGEVEPVDLGRVGGGPREKR